MRERGVGRRVRRLGAGVALVAVAAASPGFAGCASDAGGAGAAACGGPFPSGPDAPWPTLRGTAAGAELRATVMEDLPLRPGAEAKIVWRVTTGSGPLRLTAVHPDGTEVAPVWGPDPHGGPGDEWGSGFVLPKAGCWAIRVARGTTTGEVSLPVAAAG